MNTHAFAFYCELCYPIAIDASFGVHRCDRDILVFVERGTPFWNRVRESITENGSFKIPEICTIPVYEHVAEERCVFAHNIVELKLWKQEFEGNFNVKEFIKFKRTTRYDVNYIMSTYGHEFEFICKSCLRKREISRESTDDPNHCNGSIAHDWEPSKVLRCITQSGEFLIRKPFNVQHNTLYMLCESISSCETVSCVFAHSQVEKDIWGLERDQGISQEKLVVFSRALQINAERNREQTIKYNKLTDNSERKQAVNTAKVHLDGNPEKQRDRDMLECTEASYHRESIDRCQGLQKGEDSWFEMLSPYVYFRKPLLFGEDGQATREWNGMANEISSDVYPDGYSQKPNRNNDNFIGNFTVSYSMVSNRASPSEENREDHRNRVPPGAMSRRGVRAAVAPTFSSETRDRIINDNLHVSYPCIESVPESDYPQSFNDCIEEIYARYRRRLLAEHQRVWSSSRQTHQGEEEDALSSDLSSSTDTDEFTDKIGM